MALAHAHVKAEPLFGAWRGSGQQQHHQAEQGPGTHDADGLARWDAADVADGAAAASLSG